MSDYVKCEGSETKCVTGSSYEAEDWESLGHSLSIRVEHYRSFEYRLKWKTSMCPQRSIRMPKASKKKPQKSPVSDEEVIHRRLKSQRRSSWQRKAEADDSGDDSDDCRQLDIIDIINCSHDVSHAAMEEDGGQTVEITDKGLTESDDDCVSVCSIASGPSLLHPVSPLKPSPSQGLCSACMKLYQRAKRAKAPIKSKLLDIDPKSLTCDQWVLNKRWTPKGLTNVRRNLLRHVQLKKTNARDGESSSCSRPHTFLQRNLRKCVKVAKKNQKKKKTGRKRRRVGSQGPRVAKQQHLHSNNHQTNLTCMDEDPGFEGRRHQETNDQSNTVDLTPCSVTLEKIKPAEVKLKKKRPNTAGRFKDLLAQLRGNSSMIVRETR